MPEMCDWTEHFTGLKALEPTVRAVLREGGNRLELPAGTRVFSPGDPCNAWLLVEHGAVRVQMTADTGREVLLYRVRAGESCVLTTACLLGSELYAAEGTTETDTVGIAIPVPLFRKLVNESPAFRDLVFAGFGRRITDILMTLEDVAFHRLDARLARLLLERCQAGPITATHQSLAVDLGSSREVVSRQLKTFAQEGLVDLSRGRIAILDRSGLSRVARPE